MNKMKCPGCERKFMTWSDTGLCPECDRDNERSFYPEELLK